MFEIYISNYNNKCLTQKDKEYTNIDGWRVSIKLPQELPCDFLEYLRNILEDQEDAFYKLELYLAYKITDKANYVLLCTRKTTKPIEEKLCIVIINNRNIVDLISIEAKRIIRCEDECRDECYHCCRQKSMEEGIPKYYYLTNHSFCAIYSCEKSICISISMGALRLLYKIIKSYFMPIFYTNDYIDRNSQPELRAYPTAVNDNMAGYQISTTTS